MLAAGAIVVVEVMPAAVTSRVDARCRVSFSDTTYTTTRSATVAMRMTATRRTEARYRQARARRASGAPVPLRYPNGSSEFATIHIAKYCMFAP